MRARVSKAEPVTKADIYSVVVVAVAVVALTLVPGRINKERYG